MKHIKNKPLPASPCQGRRYDFPLTRGIEGVCGFTLVELIVVITILAILGTFGFMAFSGFQKDARDSKRITNISTIAAGFDINMAAGKLINTSETSTGFNIVITGSTFTMTGYYGQINNKPLDSLKVYSKDITTTTDYPYSYSYFPTEKKYQISSFLENSSNLPTAMNFINQVYAETSTGYVYIKGNFSATGGINSLIPDTTAWTTATGTPKVIAGSDTVVPGTSASAPPPAPTLVNGACTGLPSNAVYYSGVTSYSLVNASVGTILSAITAGYNASPTVNTCQWKCDTNSVYSGGNCVVKGEQVYISAITNTYTWTAPPGVTSVSVVVVSPASGGVGGALSYKNNIPVTPGISYSVVFEIGAANWNYFSGSNVVAAKPGNNGRIGDGGGNGGTSDGLAGGGAGGYSGNGGAGLNAGGSAGSGGGGGGAANRSGGGGVGIFGQGSNGAGGILGGSASGKGGSSGTDGMDRYNPGGDGGLYGGGAGSSTSNGVPGAGTIRIIWPGTSRSFPFTDVGP